MYKKLSVRIALCFVFFSFLVTSGVQASTPPVTVRTALVPVLADIAGMTLYVFDNDVGGKSSCFGSCADIWPPLMSSGDAVDAPYGKVHRPDGDQITYKGKPLYTFMTDRAPGDILGSELHGIWHVVPMLMNTNE